MDCRTFRANHCAFIDDTLPASDVVAMECHRMKCAECARHDTLVRRSLLLVRNLPPVECSAEFTDRLLARLREIEIDRRPVLTARSPGLGTFAAVAAGLLVVTLGSFGAASLIDGAPPPPPPKVLVLQPVIASEPAPVADPLTSPIIVASTAAGIPAWPAVVLADEMPMHVAEAGFTGFRMYSASW